MKLKYSFLLLPLAVLFFAGTAGAAVDTLSVRSAAMNRLIPVTAVIPDDYNVSGQTRYPVVYLLHGAGGDHNQWPDIKGRRLADVATETGIIFICPSAQNSWYWDSPVDPSMRYSTFVARELTAYVDSVYKTRADRTGRAITGLSMGGHGAFYLAMTHKDVYGAAGSTSGGMDIRPFPDNWDMSKAIGEYEANREVWNRHTVIVRAGELRNGELALIFDCGYSDFFFEVNNALHEKLLEMKIDHDYIVRPGGHDADYWNNSLDFQILFFKKYFSGRQ